MKTLISSAVAASFLFASSISADDNTKPIELSNVQMDQVTAGDLGLPNGKVIFPDFDNPAPGDAHPNFGRNDRAFEATTGHGPSVGGAGNEGPWSATVVSPVIDLVVP